MTDQEVSTRVSILMEGAKLTSGDRDVSYGDPLFNLTLAGELKRLVRAHSRNTLMSAGEQEGWDQVLTKVARAYTGGFKRDNFVDAATYAAIAGEIAEFFEIQRHRAQAEADALAAAMKKKDEEMSESLKDALKPIHVEEPLAPEDNSRTTELPQE